MGPQFKPTQQGIRGVVSSLCAILLMHGHTCSINPTQACWILREVKTTQHLFFPLNHLLDICYNENYFKIQKAKMVVL